MSNNRVKLEETKNWRRLHIGSVFVDLNESDYQDLINIFSRDLKKKMREAIANYMRSEGCSCCRDSDAHKEHEWALGKLLNVPRYKDFSGFDFTKYQTKKD